MIVKANQRTRSWLILSACLFLVIATGYATYWYALRAAYNVWAAGGPPTPTPERFLGRGKEFEQIAGICFIGFLGSVWILVRTFRRLR